MKNLNEKMQSGGKGEIVKNTKQSKKRLSITKKPK